MKTLQTFKLWLEPDREIPQFRRLRWAMETVSIRDVLLHGIHPWSGPSKHYMLPESVLQVVNDDAGRLPELEQFHYCHDIMTPSGYAWNKPSRFERTLHAIHENLYFVENLSYLELLEIAKGMLRRQWTHSLVREMARSAFPGFQELRQFLKTKDKQLKLSSYEDIDRYDMAKVLSLDDFSQRDSLVISNAIPTVNFRKVSVLEKMVDKEGRLRLTPHICHLTLTTKVNESDDKAITWCVSGEGSAWRFRPDIGESSAKRPHAEVFAQHWRTDKGRLCFTTSTEKLEEMVERGIVEPSFPTLDYSDKDKGSLASVTVHGAQVQTFHVGPYPKQNATGDLLKDILHQYEVPMTGNKDQLVKKLAALAARKYHNRLAEMDRYFEKNLYIRMRTASKNTADLPLLEDLTNLRNLILTMYAIKHLRGDAILEVSHQNDTYTEEELALALITGKVDLNGAFLRVA